MLVQIIYELSIGQDHPKILKIRLNEFEANQTRQFVANFYDFPDGNDPSVLSSFPTNHKPIKILQLSEFRRNLSTIYLPRDDAVADIDRPQVI